MIHVFVVILNWNGVSDTLECLASLDRQQLKNIILTKVVVDNASKDNSVAIIAKKFPHIVLLQNESNIGFSAGNNKGIKYALSSGADYIMILNNDTITDANLVQTLIEAMKNNKQVGIASPKIYFAKGSEFHKDRYAQKEQGKIIWYAGGIMDWENIIGHHRGVDEVDKGQYEKDQEIEVATGCCMVVAKEVFSKVGLFDARYFLYYEDSDISIKARRAGFTALYVSKAHLWHKNASSTGGSGSDLQDYYITRNRLLFGYQYASLKTKIALFKESIKLFFYGRKFQRLAVADFYKGKMGKGSYPLKN